ncbi:hypothetical protein N4G70_31915 [Streptomyces sp. ASQP_92]|uniref:hypothetical protein n=1 Tax=Streptomyces sp. ASQP_92 TaxID=2979116 RepID=UPI0021BE40B5|nr:hypothetical protein [Streptomyces sp. ASQP_92]MCT9093441.1 hypothetical protein [Streptomyces sp. ASQP_92]
MEITISEGIVRRTEGGQGAPNTPQAIQARTIANFLPLHCQRAGAKIVHNVDARYTGIRMETSAGPVIIEMPTEAGGVFRVVQEFIEPVNGKTERELVRFPQIYKAQGIAYMTSEFLRSRGFLG